MNPRSDLAAQVAALEERVDADVESWNPRSEASHPRKIAGELVERRLRPGRGFEGADAETVLIRTVEGKLWLVWLFGTVLEQEFAGLSPGDVVAVKYEGHVDGGRGARGYEMFRVSANQRAGDQPATREPAPEATARQDEEAPPAAVADLLERVRCEACGMIEPHHARGCPVDDIPF